MMRLLLKNGADIKSEDREGPTTLHQSGDLLGEDMVVLLIDKYDTVHIQGGQSCLGRRAGTMPCGCWNAKSRVDQVSALLTHLPDR
jgi:hypothetical protein